MRVHETPLTVRDCADYMGYTPAFIRVAINAGVLHRGTLVKLEAEATEINGRRSYRVYLASFRRFLIAIGWKHLPAPYAGPDPPVHEAPSEIH